MANFLQKLLGSKPTFREARTALDAGRISEGLALLREESDSEALLKAERLARIGETLSAAEHLLACGTRSPAEDLALDSLGREVLKEGWAAAGLWLPPRLYHFTNLTNLPEILACGEVLSRFRMEMRGIDPPTPGGDERSWVRDRQQGLQDYIHLAVVAPHPMLFKAAARIRQPVYLTLTSALALRKESRYSNRNATDSGATLYDEINDLRGILHFALAGAHPAENKAAVQAEVLVKGGIRIEPGILLGVLFRSRFEMDSAIKTCRPEGWLAERFRVDESVF